MERNALDDVANETYVNMFTNLINDEEGFLSGPDEDIVTAGRDWYRAQNKEEWTLNYTAHSGIEYQLFADYLAAETDQGITLLGIHGFSSAAKNAGGIVKIFWDAGINIVTPDMRGHGRSLDPSRGMGTVETDDIIVWLNEILRRKPNEKIIIIGISMGASIVLQAVSRADLPENVIGIIEDCGYESLPGVMKTQVDKLPLSDEDKQYVLSAVENKLINEQGKKFDDGLLLNDLNNAKVPLLAISGSADTSVPPEMTFRITEAYGSTDKSTWIVEGAGHPTSVSTQYENYKRNVLDFTFYQQGLRAIIYGVTDHTIHVGDDIDLLAGVSAKDKIDGDLTAQIIVDGDVNTNIVGDYNVTYTVTNSRNITTSQHAIFSVIDELIMSSDYRIMDGFPEEGLIIDRNHTQIKFNISVCYLGDKEVTYSATDYGMFLMSLYPANSNSPFIDVFDWTTLPPVLEIKKAELVEIHPHLGFNNIDIGEYRLALRVNASDVDDAVICSHLYAGKPNYVNVKVIDND